MSNYLRKAYCASAQASRLEHSSFRGSLGPFPTLPSPLSCSFHGDSLSLPLLLRATAIWRQDGAGHGLANLTNTGGWEQEGWARRLKRGSALHRRNGPGTSLGASERGLHKNKDTHAGGSESQVEITRLLQPPVLKALSVLRIRQAVCLVDIDWGLSLHQAPV